MSERSESEQAVIYEVEGPVAIITIDRPQVRNAVDGPTADLLAAAFRRFEADESLAVAVLTGASKTFCAGADLKAISDGRGNTVAPEGDGPMGPTRLKLSKPVIAAIEGWAVAGGLELALWADLRVMADDATFGVFCRRWGVPLVDGGTVRLPRLIGESRAMDLILTGRPVQADEAERIGLANRVVPSGTARDAAVAFARSLADFPQGCLRSDRASAKASWDADFDSAMAFETKVGFEIVRSGETREGATRFAEGKGRGGSFSNINE